jgi:hypothetical protein
MANLIPASHVLALREIQDVIRSELKAAGDDLYERFSPFRTRTTGDLADDDIRRDDTERRRNFSKFLGGDEEAADRADALRAFRRAW